MPEVVPAEHSQRRLISTSGFFEATPHVNHGTASFSHWHWPCSMCGSPRGNRKWNKSRWWRL